jgi:hypothetical protein
MDVMFCMRPLHHAIDCRYQGTVVERIQGSDREKNYQSLYAAQRYLIRMPYWKVVGIVINW